MTDEEKEAIETMKHWIDYEKANKDKINKADELIEIQDTVLNLIEKQQTEIRQYGKALHDQIIKDYDMESKLKAELEKKDKIIDEMAKYWQSGFSYCEDCDRIVEDYDSQRCETCIKEYFKKKVEG